MSRNIGYNKQRNNITENNLNGYKQCFFTVAWMLMSFYTEYIIAADDQSLANYVLYCEHLIKGVEHPGFLFTVQRQAIAKYLADNGYYGNVNFSETYHVDDLYQLVQKVPVIVGTERLGGLPDGHIILLNDVNGPDAFDSNDPFGNANTNYADDNGEQVLYTLDMLRPHIDYGGGNCHIIYVN